MVILMEENNDIFLGDGNALVYLAGPIRNKYFTTIVSGYPFSTYVSYDRIFNPTPLPPRPFIPCTHMYSFRVIPFCVRDFIDLILSSPILTRLVCHSFLILFYLKNFFFFFVSDTHHFLASHSVNSSLPGKIFSLMVASNCQLFYLS